MMKSRNNRGHSLEVLPDIHPYEADKLSDLSGSQGEVCGDGFDD